MGTNATSVQEQPSLTLDTRTMGSEGRILALDDMHLQIGDVLVLDTSFEAAHARYSVRLIGYLKGRSLLVTNPVVDDKLLFLREGQAFQARTFSGKNVFMFSTSVLRVCSQPYPYLHLANPTNLRGIVLRRGERVSASLIAAIAPRVDQPFNIAGTLRDISTSGAQLHCKQPIGEKGATVLVKFRVNVCDLEVYLTLNALIRRVSTEDESGETHKGGFYYGLEFRDLTREDALTVTSFVYDRLLHGSAAAH